MAQVRTGTRSRLTGWLRQRPSRVLRYCAPRSQRSGGDGKTLLRNEERGQSLVELGIILPLLFLIFLAILDLGRAVYASHVVANCAREGARFGRVSPDDTAGITAVAQSAAVGLDAAEITVTVSHPTADQVRVDVQYTFRLLTPLIAGVLGRDSLVLHNAATMYTGY